MVQMLARFGVKGTPLLPQEWTDSLKEDLLNSALRWDNSVGGTHQLRREDFLKFSFREVSDQVGRMNVLLRRGTAYVHKRDLGEQVVKHFREKLRSQLELFSEHRSQALS